MNKTDQVESGPKRQLTLLDSTCVIVGIIIGAGIYQTTPLIAANASGPGAWLYELVFQLSFGRSVEPMVPLSVVGPPSLVMVWLLGGFVALVGSVCYAELTTRYPREGGDYVFLTRAYGRSVGLLFVWCEFWIIRPCGIGAMAFVFARYASELTPWHVGRAGQLGFACGSIVILTATNLLGVKTGKTTQNVLTITKVLALVAIFFVSMFLIEGPQAETRPADFVGQPSFRLAIIMVLFTYGGWNDVSFVAAEVKDPRKNLLRALVVGTLAVTLIYVFLNVAFVKGLGFSATSTSDAVAADLLEVAFPAWGGRLISLLICVSCLGAINGMVFAGARIYYAMGTEHRTFSWFGRWNQRMDSPLRGLLAQAAVTVALVVTFGWYSASNQSGFERLVVFYSPLFWLFFLMSSISLFVFRVRQKDASDQVYRVVFFPVTPVLFSLSCVFLLYSSVTYAIGTGYWEGFFALAVLGVGILVAVIAPMRVGSDSGSES